MPSAKERRERGVEMLGALYGRDAAPAAADRIHEELGALGSYILDVELGAVWSRPGLAPRDRSMVVLAVVATLGLPDEVAEATRQALNLDLSEDEIEEVMIQLAMYAGFPRARIAVRACRQVFATRPGSGSRRSEAVPRTEDEQRAAARILGERVFGPLPASDRVTVDLGTFTGIATRYSYGDIWWRPQLSFRERGLVIVASLAVQGKITEMRIHMRAARSHGVSDQELEELLITTCVYAGFPTAVEGFWALRDVQRDDSSPPDLGHPGS